MSNTSQVISFDSDRISHENINNIHIVHKKTSNLERDNLIKADIFLKNKSINVKNNDYCIKVPHIYSWDNNTHILSMSFCER